MIDPGDMGTLARSNLLEDILGCWRSGVEEWSGAASNRKYETGYTR